MTFVGDFDIVKQSESHRSKEVSEKGCHADNQPESETFIGFLAFCLMLALASMIIFVLSALLLLLFPSVLDIPQTIFTRNTAFYSWIFFSQIMLVMRADDDRNNYWDFNSYADKSLVLIHFFCLPSTIIISFWDFVLMPIFSIKPKYLWRKLQIWFETSRLNRNKPAKMETLCKEKLKLQKLLKTRKKMLSELEILTTLAEKSREPRESAIELSEQTRKELETAIEAIVYAIQGIEKQQIDYMNDPVFSGTSDPLLERIGKIRDAISESSEIVTDAKNEADCLNQGAQVVREIANQIEHT